MGGDGGDQALQNRSVMLLRTVARRHVAAATWKLLMCFHVLSYLLVSGMGELTAFRIDCFPCPAALNGFCGLQLWV